MIPESKHLQIEQDATGQVPAAVSRASKVWESRDVRSVCGIVSGSL